MSEFAKYQAMKEAGVAPTDVYRRALADGINSIEVIRLLRVVYDLDLVQAKEVVAMARGAASLEEAQGRLVDGLERAAKDT